MIFKKRNPDGSLVPYTSWDTAREAFMQKRLYNDVDR